MAKKLFSVRDMVLCAIFASLLCIASPFTLPVGPVPLSLCNFALMTAACIIGCGRSVISTAVFVAVGALGLPVFGGGMGGFGHILAPTGGFILSYIPMAAVSGAFASLGRGRKNSLLLSFAGCFLSVLLGYIIGTVWYAFSADVQFSRELLGICVLPFLPFDLLKCVGAVLISEMICSRLKLFSEKNMKNQGF